MSSLQESLELLSRSIAEDQIGFDETTDLVLADQNPKGEARIVARSKGVFHGEMIFKALGKLSDLKATIFVVDGQVFESGQALVKIEGSLREILGFERSVLNIVSHLTGVATLTARYVSELRNTKTKILATRKTLPGLRNHQLAAVVSGGGFIHRRSLSDGVLIKDNHLKIVGIGLSVERAKRKASPLHKIEVEVDSISQLQEVLNAKPDIVLLDNFDLPEIEEAVKLVSGKCLIEVSGGIDLSAVGPISELGVDFISVGRLTHSVPAQDLSLEIN